VSKPYAIVSDVHCHNWSQFATTNAVGINSRLQAILNELERAASTLKAAGGRTLVVAGDLFHVRGKIEPSVFNPTFDAFERIADKGLEVLIIPGNHDLEGKHADKLGNAMQQLQQISGMEVVVTPEWSSSAQVRLIPWIENLDDLRATMDDFAFDKSTVDLVIHAPLNSVIRGIPDHGLTPEELAALGYRRVFVGHYHNHKEFPGGVYSVGATTHQTWSDPGTAAGFLLVYPDRVEHHPTQAPLFMNVDAPDDVGKHLKGNYVRLRLMDEEESVIKATKAAIEKIGALGIVDHSSKKRPQVRANGSSKTGLTLEASVASYVGQHLETKLDKKKIALQALDVLSEARMVGADA